LNEITIQKFSLLKNDAILLKRIFVELRTKYILSVKMILVTIAEGIMMSIEEFF
jgi:hypothetical protein